MIPIIFVVKGQGHSDLVHTILVCPITWNHPYKISLYCQYIVIVLQVCCKFVSSILPHY